MYIQKKKRKFLVLLQEIPEIPIFQSSLYKIFRFFEGILTYLDPQNSREDLKKPGWPDNSPLSPLGAIPYLGNFCEKLPETTKNTPEEFHLKIGYLLSSQVDFPFSGFGLEDTPIFSNSLVVLPKFSHFRGFRSGGGVQKALDNRRQRRRPRRRKC